MPELPLLAKAGVAALLAASIARGFAGAPAARPRPGAAGVLLLAAVALYGAATATLAAGRVGSSALLAIAGVEAACASAWLARADCGGGGGGDGGDDDEPAGPCGPPPIDWDAFDRARRDWERKPTTTPRPPSSPSWGPNVGLAAAVAVGRSGGPAFRRGARCSEQWYGAPRDCSEQ